MPADTSTSKHSKIYDIFKLALSNTLDVGKEDIIKTYNNLLPAILRNPIFHRKGLAGTQESGFNNLVQGLINYLTFAKKLLADEKLDAHRDERISKDKDKDLLQALNLRSNKKWANVSGESQRVGGETERVIRTLSQLYYNLERDPSRFDEYSFTRALSDLKHIASSNSPKAITATMARKSGAGVSDFYNYLVSTELTKEDLVSFLKFIKRGTPESFLGLFEYGLDTSNQFLMKNLASLRTLGLNVELSVTTDAFWYTDRPVKINGIAILGRVVDNSSSELELPDSFDYNDPETNRETSVYFSHLNRYPETYIPQMPPDAVQTAISTINQTISKIKTNKSVEFSVKKAIQSLKNAFSIDSQLIARSIETINALKRSKIETCQKILQNLNQYGQVKAAATKSAVKSKPEATKNIFSQYESKTLIGKCIIESFRN